MVWLCRLSLRNIWMHLFRPRKWWPCWLGNLGTLRLLEAQLQTQSRHHKDELEALHTQIELLRDNIEKKQEMLNYAASLSPEAKVEYSVQQEITRLTNENLVRDSVATHSTVFSNCFRSIDILLFCRTSKSWWKNWKRMRGSWKSSWGSTWKRFRS